MGCLMYLIIARRKQNKIYEQKEKMKELERQHLESQIEVQESTLTSVGKELHDNIGQLLSSAKMLLGVAQLTDGNVQNVIAKVDEILNQIIGSIHDLSQSLDSDYLKRFNIVENLEVETKRNNAVNSKMRFHLSSIEHVPLEPEDQIVLFRIIQEGIQNAVKHSGAANVFISIDQFDDNLLVSVIDDGKGFDAAVQPKGIGLSSIASRARSLGGEAVWNQRNPGTELLIKNLKLKS